MTQNIKDKIGTWGLKIAGFVVLGMQVLKYYNNTLEFTTGEVLIFLFCVVLILKPRLIITLFNDIRNKFKSK